MSIQISKHIRDELPADEKADIKDQLILKAGGDPTAGSVGICSLCDQPLDQLTETINADHDTPTALGGETRLSNLQLAHKSCNSAKQNNPTVDVRPYLRLKGKVKEKGQPLHYEDCLSVFECGDLVPCSYHWTKPSKTAVFRFKTEEPKLKKQTVVVFEEQLHIVGAGTPGRVFSAYVEVPASSLHSDDEVQPRPIKPLHAFAIFKDFSRNPLHEAPAARLIPRRDGEHKLLMFDGQHKAIAQLMAARASVVVKVYLEFSLEKADYLVNSIQAEAVKLPLTTLEAAFKMASEFRAEYRQFLKDAPAEQKSELGFANSKSGNRRGRALREVAASVVESITRSEEPELELKKSLPEALTENVYKNKMLLSLIHVEPLADLDQKRIELRSNEKANVVSILNEFWETCIKPGKEADAAPNDALRSKRMIKQAALKYSLETMKAALVFRLNLKSEEEKKRVLIDRLLTKKHLSMITEMMEQLRNHPIWVTPEDDTSTKVVKFREVLSKNQGAAEAFAAVNLSTSYVLGLEKVTSKDLR